MFIFCLIVAGFLKHTSFYFIYSNFHYFYILFYLYIYLYFFPPFFIIIISQFPNLACGAAASRGARIK